MLMSTDLTARVDTMVGKRVRRQRPLAVKEAHTDRRIENGGAYDGVGVACGHVGAGVDGVEKVADVDVDVLKGLILRNGEKSVKGFFFFFGTRTKRK